MRLLHTKTLQLHEVLDHHQVPYAILSHRWNNNEVTFKDVEGGHAEAKKSSYKKLRDACRQARQDGHEYIWIDTCCIDKSSSAELSMAINSMFQWYASATVCYAYLSDVFPHYEGEAKLEHRIQYSSWFTRGWTLQELIASQEVKFFQADWSLICRKSTHASILSVITGIDETILQGSDFRQLSVAKRMSWASRRETTRIEDQAYSLLGLFDVNMPLLYGEGARAFVRLQQEIIKSSDDHTIFAWGLTWSTRPKLSNLDILASSPAAFSRSSDVVSCSAVRGEEEESYELTNAWLRIRLPLRETLWMPRGPVHYGILNCRLKQDPFKRLAIPLKIDPEGRFCRTSEAWGHIPYRDLKRFKPRQTLVAQWAKVNTPTESAFNYAKNDSLCWIRSMLSEDQGFQLQEVFPSTAWNAANRHLLIHTNSLTQAAQAVMRFKSSKGDNLLVNLVRSGVSKSLIVTIHTWRNPADIRLSEIYGHNQGFDFDGHPGGITDEYSGVRVRHSYKNFFGFLIGPYPSKYLKSCFRRDTIIPYKVDILEGNLLLPRFLNNARDALYERLETIKLTRARAVDYVALLLTFSEDEDKIYEFGPLFKHAQQKTRKNGSGKASTFDRISFGSPVLVLLVFQLIISFATILTFDRMKSYTNIFTRVCWDLSPFAFIQTSECFCSYYCMSTRVKICPKTLRVFAGYQIYELDNVVKTSGEHKGRKTADNPMKLS